MKNVSNFVVMTMVFALAACSGGGGGGTGTGGGGGTGTVYGCLDSSAINYNSNATVSDGSCSYSGGGGAGTGTASYYGVSTTSSTIASDISEATLDGAASNKMKISNEFYMHVTDADTRDFEMYVYQPTCVVGSTQNKYAAVLVKGSATSPTVVQVVQTASGVVVVERKAKSTINSGPLYPFVMEDVSSATVSGSCDSNSGIMTLSGSAGTVLGNGKIILVKKANGDVYAGIHESKIATSFTSMTNPLKYNSYGIDSAMGTVDDSGSGHYSVVTAGYTVSGYCFNDYNSVRWDIKLTADNAGTTSYLAVNHFAMFKGSEGTGQNQKVAYGVAASNIAGKALVFVTRPVNDSGDGLGGTTSMQGSGKLEVSVGQ